MLSKIILYSFAAITLGIAVMLFPIFVMLFFPFSISTPSSYQQTVSEAPSSAETTMPTKDLMGKICEYNATRGLSTLSEVAQFYGKADITTYNSAEVEKDAAKSFSMSHISILIPIAIVASAALLASLSVKVFINRFFKVRM